MSNMHEEEKLACTANKEFAGIGWRLGALRVGFSDEGHRWAPRWSCGSRLRLMTSYSKYTVLVLMRQILNGITLPICFHIEPAETLSRTLLLT